MLTALEVLFIIRLALIAMGIQSGAFRNFAYLLTEPVIMPIRALLLRIETVRKASMDISLAIGFSILVFLKYTFVYR